MWAEISTGDGVASKNGRTEEEVFGCGDGAHEGDRSEGR